MQNLYDKFLNNSLSPEEEKELQLLLKNKKHKKAFKTYLRDTRDTYAALQDPDLEKAYYKIINYSYRPENHSVRFLNVNWLKFVAILLIALLTSYGIYVLKSKDTGLQKSNETSMITLELEDGTTRAILENDNKTISNSKGKTIARQEKNSLLYPTGNDRSKKESIRYNKLSVPNGKKFHLVLSDGTHVYINSGSTLRYPVTFFNGVKRDVFLDGEAYFEVTKDSESPFTVITKNMNTRVLGTKFNVSSYKDEKSTSTVLVAGRVEVYNAKQHNPSTQVVSIEPGERALYQADSISTKKVNVEKYIAWTEGKLFFIDDTFDSILKKLERHFNVTINNTYKDLDSEFFTGSFETESLDQIMETFKAYTPFNYTVNGDTITINK